LIGIDGANRLEVERALILAHERHQPTVPLAPDAVTEALTIRVPRSPLVHALNDGQVLVQAASGPRALNGEEIRALLSARSSGDFEDEIVPGARIGDLDPARVADFVEACARQGDPQCHDLDAPLVEMGAVTPDYHVTVAGMLLFGRAPQRWLPHSGARFLRYVGQTPALDQGVGGPLVRVIESLWELIRTQMRTSTASGELQYPLLAVQEALVNAAVHRDYRLRGERVTVSMYADHLDITSPGGLPGFLTQSDHLFSHRYRRNPRLSGALRAWGYGQSILHMVSQGNGHRPTEITARPYAFTVRFYAAGDPLPDEEALPLSDRQQAALDYVRDHGSITLREFQMLCGAIAPAALQTDLSGLADAGHLRPIGKANVYYILP
jgi:ATP-dependent DNA helicase RecG